MRWISTLSEIAYFIKKSVKILTNMKQITFLMTISLWVHPLRINDDTVKPVLSGHPRDPRYCPLNGGVRLVQVDFTENKGGKNGLKLSWGPLNAGCPLNMVST